MSGQHADPGVKVVTFYRFVSLPDHVALARVLRRRGRDAGLLGTIILAEEGINATLAGEPLAIDRWLDRLAVDSRFADLRVRESAAQAMPFYRLKIRVRREIVTFGQPGTRPGPYRSACLAA